MARYLLRCDKEVEAADNVHFGCLDHILVGVGDPIGSGVKRELGVHGVIKSGHRWLVRDVQPFQNG